MNPTRNFNTTEDRKEWYNKVYWPEWWRQNRERRNEERRKRYQQDKTYRKKVLEAKRSQNKERSPRGTGQPRLIKMDNRELLVFSLGTAASMLSLDQQRLRQIADQKVPFAYGTKRLWFDIDSLRNYLGKI